jgi:hypothetical protein
MKNTIGDKIRKFFKFFAGRKRRGYVIGGRTYIQKPLVLGQFRQLFDLLKGTTVDANAGAAGLILAVGSRLPAALAVVLVEEGKSPAEKDLETLAAAIEFDITAEQAMEIVDGFFVCNPLTSFLERIAGLLGSIGSVMPATATGSPSFASSSATGISPGGTLSSGE